MIKKILIVDDQPLSRELLNGYLERENYQVFEAANADEGRLIINKENPDLILLDVMMPGEDGFTFCKAIKKQWQEPFLPIILVTALNDKESRIQGLACGADDFLSKPLDQIELIIKVRNMLKIRELHSNLYTELLFARKVQEHLFFTSDTLNEEDKLFYQPCRQVGGDLIEVWEQEDSRWAFLADASGHGPSAALIAATVKALINKNCPSPSALLKHLNTKLHSLLANEDVTYYVTGICVKIDKNLLSFAGAGHPPGFLKNFNTNNLLQLESHSMPLGIIPLQPFEEQSFPYEKTDLLFLYSDGLFDVFKETELKSFLNARTDYEQIYQELVAKIKKSDPSDDISFLSLLL